MDKNTGRTWLSRKGWWNEMSEYRIEFPPQQPQPTSPP